MFVFFLFFGYLVSQLNKKPTGKKRKRRGAQKTPQRLHQTRAPSSPKFLTWGGGGTATGECIIGMVGGWGVETNDNGAVRTQTVGLEPVQKGGRA